MDVIEAKNLRKEFKVFKRPKGAYHAVRSLFIRNYEIKEAVKDISFSVEEGETIGYIGPNGAGKSTTIKMLSGILVPTSGTISVNGIVPYENRKENAMQIGIVFGQRSQLNWDLPMEDTFQLYKKMYHIDDRTYKDNVEMFVELMDMGSFLRKPVRQLSLGQKMRAEIAISMLHSPKLLYLDEPTIGLDVLVKDHIRTFIRELNREKKTTVILTTHDMKDIDTICSRIIMIDHGEILEDMPLAQFKEHHQEFYLVQVEYESKLSEPEHPGIRLVGKNGNRNLYQIKKEEISVNQMMVLFSRCFVIKNIDIRQEEIEEIVRHLMETP